MQTDFLKKIRKKIRGIGKRTKIMDDFNWSFYYKDEYSKQINDMEKEYTFVIPAGKFSIVGEKIVLDRNLRPLHPNHQALYEAVLKIKPDSVLEAGCGCGDHLANIRKFLPDAKLIGLDLLSDQINFLCERHPELKNQAELFTQDLSAPLKKNIKADLVFTQAVLMHIQRRKHYLSALKNIFSMSNKTVVLMENWERHNFFDDIKEVSQNKNFPWKSIFFHINPTDGQMALVLSKERLSQFKEIKSGKELV